ncbi:MAG: N5-carboxyaminoimidazole ribonucleotide synthase, partial [uncultured Rubrobacteraceae bacterium]
ERTAPARCRRRRARGRPARPDADARSPKDGLPGTRLLPRRRQPGGPGLQPRVGRPLRRPGGRPRVWPLRGRRHLGVREHTRRDGGGVVFPGAGAAGAPGAPNHTEPVAGEGVPAGGRVPGGGLSGGGGPGLARRRGRGGRGSRGAQDGGLRLRRQRADEDLDPRRRRCGLGRPRRRGRAGGVGGLRDGDLRGGLPRARRVVRPLRGSAEHPPQAHPGPDGRAGRGAARGRAGGSGYHGRHLRGAGRGGSGLRRVLPCCRGRTPRQRDRAEAPQLGALDHRGRGHLPVRAAAPRRLRPAARQHPPRRTRRDGEPPRRSLDGRRAGLARRPRRPRCLPPPLRKKGTPPRPQNGPPNRTRLHARRGGTEGSGRAKRRAPEGRAGGRKL